MKNKYLKKSGIIAVVVIMSGCANFNSIHRELDVDSGKGAFIDIKQRAVIVSKKKEGNDVTTIVCAEPSPDALSAYAAELAAKGGTLKANVELTSAFQEGSSFVGLRTQSIQVLRDNLYNLCQGYMIGALDKSKYDILMRRYQKYMVALLGIEQLTGVVKVPAVTISSQGSAEAARSISSMRMEIESINGKIKALEQQKTGSDITDAQKTEIDKHISELKSDKEAITKGIDNARGLSASGSVKAIVDSGQSTPRSDEHIQAIAKVVSDIVLKVVNTDDTGQLCFSYLTNPTMNNQNDNLKQECISYFKNLNESNYNNIEMQKFALALEKRIAELAKKNNKTALEKSELDTLERQRSRLAGSSSAAASQTELGSLNLNIMKTLPGLQELRE